MSIEVLVALTGVAGLILTALQWWFSHQASSRQRDAEMTRWAWDVIDLMAELETVCAPLDPAEPPSSSSVVEAIGHRASALVDKGRLFFPNVKQGTVFRGLGSLLTGDREGREIDEEGVRVKVLDEVLRACYVARHLATGPAMPRATLREQVWSARRRFVALVQGEMGRSLRRVSKASAGDHIPSNPAAWCPPKYTLNLPTKRQGD